MKARYFLLLFLWTLAPSVVFANETIKVGVFTDQLVFFNTLLEQSQCPDIQSSDVGVNQMLAEYLVVCKLILDSKHVNIELVGFPIVPRIVDAITDGEIHVTGFGVWKGESQSEHVIHSDALLKKGQFTKGLYVTRKTLLKLPQEPQSVFNELVAVSNRNWSYDWSAFNCSGMAVLHVDRYAQMFKLLERGRADVLALAFGKHGSLDRTEFGVRLYPIQGVKMVIPDSSHILVSSKTTHATWLQNAINQGLKELRAKQELQRIYVKIGTLNPDTQEWINICA